MQRKSFSFGMMGTACGLPVPNPNPDPDACVYLMGGASAGATPAAAITRTGSSGGSGNAGSWAVNAPGSVSITLNYRAAPDCGVGTSASSGQVKLVRWNNAVSPRVVQTVFDAIVPLTPTPMPLPAGSFSDGNGGPPSVAWAARRSTSPRTSAIRSTCSASRSPAPVPASR